MLKYEPLNKTNMDSHAFAPCKETHYLQMDKTKYQLDGSIEWSKYHLITKGYI